MTLYVCKDNELNRMLDYGGMIEKEIQLLWLDLAIAFIFLS